MWRRTIPLFITFFVGSVLVMAEFIPHRPFGSLGEDFSLYFDIIAVFAFLLGGGNLCRVHLSKVYRRKKDWPFSIVTLLGFSVMLVAGLFKIGNPVGMTGDVAATGSMFANLYDSIFTPLQGTMYALLAFFVASASYRAFRAKNIDATILLLAAFVILLGRTPAPALIAESIHTAWPGFLHWIGDIFNFIPDLTDWIMDVPNKAGQRAILIGIALGVISMALRLILGVERTYLGSDK
jgi:hypothetical protein